MDYQDIVYDKRDGVATITINRPEVMNAFRAKTVEEMLDALPTRALMTRSASSC